MSTVFKPAIGLWAASLIFFVVQLRERAALKSAGITAPLSWETLFSCTVTGFLTVYVLAKAFVGVFYDTDVFAKTWEFVSSFLGQEKRRGIVVDSWIDEYNGLHDDNRSTTDERLSNYSKLVNAYYELATLFYEVGWGTSFHFAYRLKGESFAESIRRHEYYLAGRLGVSKGARVLDCGCGVGGPYRNITRFTGADVTGITINEYQVSRGNLLSRKAGLEQRCRSIQGDFMKLPFEADSFDGVYAIEATCHAPRREGVYGEIFRVLKPGSVFACYEWCLTDKYDEKRADHRLIKKQIEEGDGLPDMCRPEAVVAALKSVGFEVMEHRDMALDENDGGVSWYQPLTPSYNVLTQRFQFTPAGMWLTRWGLWLLEAIRVAPPGTCKVQAMLQQAALGCSQGGQTGTFTPMYLMVARKPLK